jgi:hypothetical protein
MLHSGSVPGMSERDEAYAELAEAGVVDAVRWAARSAYRRAFEDHDEDAGYDRASFGYNAYTLLQDRLDRVFGTGRFAGADSEVVGLGLHPADAAAMPRLPEGLITRADLNGSHGWRAGRWRLLLIKTDFAQVDTLHWSAKSPTRQEVAAQPHPDQLALALPGQADDGDEDLVTLMVAHSGDRLSGARELHLARPRNNPGGGPPWYWRVDLAEGAAETGRDREPVADAEPVDVPDAQVRLRPVPAAGVGPA